MTSQDEPPCIGCSGRRTFLRRAAGALVSLPLLGVLAERATAAGHLHCFRTYQRFLWMRCVCGRWVTTYANKCYTCSVTCSTFTTLGGPC